MTYTPPPGTPDPSGYDKYGNARFDPPPPDGRGPWVLLGLLALIGLIGGLLYFGGNRADDEIARAPADRPTLTDTVRTPNTPALPGAGTTERAPGGINPAPAEPTTPAAPAQD